jgi:hypothetical protein
MKAAGVGALLAALATSACSPPDHDRHAPVSAQVAALGSTQGLGGQWAQIYTSRCVTTALSARGGARLTGDGGLLLSGEVNNQFCVVKIAPDRSIAWERNYGGAGNAYQISDLELTADGGFVLAGQTNAASPTTMGAWFFKAAADGSLNLQEQLHGPSAAVLRAVRETPDGYVLFGYNGANPGFTRWLLKTDRAGELVWERGFQSNRAGGEDSLVRYPDGTLLFSDNEAIIKTDADGNAIWQKTYGVPIVTRLRVLPDGGAIVLGFDGGGTPVFRLNAQGGVVWARRIGGTTELLRDVEPTPDGGFILTGDIHRNGSPALPDVDLWVVKLDANGSTEWQKAYGGAQGDYGTSVLPTQDGYIAVGMTRSFGVADPNCSCGERLWIVKLDLQGSAGTCAAFMDDTTFANAPATTSVTTEASAWQPISSQRTPTDIAPPAPAMARFWLNVT